MIKQLLFLLVFFNFSIAFGQTIKTDVLVIGGSPSGIAAAIQSARSKVKTILVEQGPKISINLNTSLMLPHADLSLLPGIWGEFNNDIEAGVQKSLNPPGMPSLTIRIDSNLVTSTFIKIMDTVKNLNLHLNTALTSLKKDGDQWEVKLTKNGKTETIKARVVIDATYTMGVIEKAGAKSSSFKILQGPESKEYRTSIAAGADVLIRYDTLNPITNPPFPGYIIPIKSLIATGADNLLTIGSIFSGSGAMYLPAQLSIGQGAGVIAAYCAFFKTTTSNLKVRAIQTELLDFKGYLLPFEDTGNDPQWRAIQQVCATGMLKGVQKVVDGKTEFIFNSDSTVTTTEVKSVMLEIYTRAFLWFNKEKPGRDFTISNLLSFISEITLNDPENLKKTIARSWKIQYKFKSDFDLYRPITRREFAILTNQYLNPFARTVDMDGRIVN